MRSFRRIRSKVSRRYRSAVDHRINSHGTIGLARPLISWRARKTMGFASATGPITASTHCAGLRSRYVAASIVIASGSEAIHARSNEQMVDCFVAFVPRNEADSCGSAQLIHPRKRSAPHPIGQLAKIARNDIPVAGGLKIVLLQRAVFGWAGDEGGL
jgi:hypothetical protein